eukprot:2559386-Amphidinium_carterae.1
MYCCQANGRVPMSPAAPSHLKCQGFGCGYSMLGEGRVCAGKRGNSCKASEEKGKAGRHYLKKCCSSSRTSSRCTSCNLQLPWQVDQARLGSIT